MKTHTTKRAKAQHSLEDAQEEAAGYEMPTEIMSVVKGDEDIECTLEDIDEYSESMDAESEEAAALNEAQYDLLVDGTPDTDAFTGFLAWLKAEDMLHDPDVKYWVITGRLPGNDEDSSGTYGPCTRAEAIAAFTADQQDGENLEYIRARYGDTIFISFTFSSSTPIE